MFIVYYVPDGKSREVSRSLKSNTCDDIDVMEFCSSKCKCIWWIYIPWFTVYIHKFTVGELSFISIYGELVYILGKWVWIYGNRVDIDFISANIFQWISGNFWLSTTFIFCAQWTA